MRIFKRKRKTPGVDPLEQRLDTISDLTRGLGRTEFNNLIGSVELVFEARQKLNKVKTDDEKEMAEVDSAEKKLKYLEEK